MTIVVLLFCPIVYLFASYYCRHQSCSGTLIGPASLSPYINMKVINTECIYWPQHFVCLYMSKYDSLFTHWTMAECLNRLHKKLFEGWFITCIFLRFVFNPGRGVWRTTFLDQLWLRLYTQGSNWKLRHLGAVVWKSTLHELKAQRVIRSRPAHGARLVWNQIENIASKFQAWEMRKNTSGCTTVRFIWMDFIFSKGHVLLCTSAPCRSCLSLSACFKGPMCHI